MPITDLTGTTWRINEVPVVSQSLQPTIFYTANNSDYVAFVCIPTSPGNYQITYATQSGSSDPDVIAYNTLTGGWNTTGGADYRTIVISEDQHGQTGVTNSAFIAWLEANAVQVVPAVTISYDGGTIATMDESGTKTLNTAGKYCDGDIEVKYTEPTPSLENKTVSPTTSSQSVTADSGYDGLGTVTVNAISPTKSAQTYTPTTTNQTIASGQWLTGTQTILGDANLTAENIKKDVSIFGVTGTYEGSGGGESITFRVESKIGTPIFYYVDSDGQAVHPTVTASDEYTMMKGTIFVAIASTSAMGDPITWTESGEFYPPKLIRTQTVGSGTARRNVCIYQAEYDEYIIN